jgi:DNA-binding transcriptional MerR regulator
MVKGIRGIIPGGLSVKDFSVVTHTSEETARQLLDNFMQNGIGTFQDNQILFQDNDRLKTSLLALKMGAPIDEISQILDWKDFEALVSEILKLREFDITQNVILTKPRMQIDVVGIKNGVALLIDCKHWKRLSHSALETVVSKQIERTKQYVIKEKIRAALPAIVTLYQEETKFINKVPIIPIFQLDSFCDEFYGNLEEMDLEQSE